MANTFTFSGPNNSPAANNVTVTEGGGLPEDIIITRTWNGPGEDIGGVLRVSKSTKDPSTGNFTVP